MWLMPSPVAFTVISYVTFLYAVCTQVYFTLFLLWFLAYGWVYLIVYFAVFSICSFMMPCGSGWGFYPKQGLVTLPRFAQPLSAPAGSRVTRPLLRGKMMLNWYTFCASFGARWYRIDILAVNILWLYYVNISLSYFPIEFALWANYLSAFEARWYRIDILAVNILWLYYVDISLSYFPIEFALWANYLSAIWLFVFCSHMVKYRDIYIYIYIYI